MFRLKLIVTVVVAAILSVPTVSADENVEAIAERAYEILMTKDYDAAFPLMKQAAEGGDCISQGLLGTMYYEGKGTKVNYAQALRWWSEAENGGCNEPNRPYLEQLLSARVFIVDNIRYLINEDNTLSVTFTHRDKNNYQGISTVVIPEQVTYNGKTYPVTKIGSYAFAYCQALTSITIPNSVKSFEESAFYECNRLKQVNINSIEAWCKIIFKNFWSNPISIAHHLYLNGNEVTELSIPNTITEIKEDAFKGCEGLTKVIIPNSVTSIGYDAFYNCSSLADVVIPNSVISIDTDAFGNTAWYNNQPAGMVYAGQVAYKYRGYMPEKTQITLREGTKGIASQCFSDYCSNLTSIYIPNTVITIGYRAFYNCYSLKSVTIPNSVKTIGANAFESSGLKSVSLSNSLTYIGNQAFFSCDLGAVTLPGSLLYIGKSAFTSCKISSINIPSSVTYIGAGAFSSCEKLKSITVAGGNSHYDSRGDCNAIIETATNTLIVGCKNTIIPNSITTIGSSAFLYSGLSSFNIPSSVTHIGDGAFSCCDFTSVTIPNTVTAIDEYAFSGCKKMKSLTIGSAVTFIGKGAFFDCVKLEEIKSNIANVDNIKIGRDVFFCVPYWSCALLIPRGSSSIYKKNEQWKKFEKISEQ